MGWIWEWPEKPLPPGHMKPIIRPRTEKKGCGKAAAAVILVLFLPAMAGIGALIAVALRRIQ